jgi:hypothetical protein
MLCPADHGHCRSCQKASGTGHASHVMVSEELFRGMIKMPEQ